MHVIKKWHELVETGNKDIYDEILADDVVFYSPVVHTPQKGKEITKIYLSAAGNVFGKQHWRICRNQSLDTVKKLCRVIRPCLNLSQR